MGCVEGGFRSRSLFSYPPPRVREKTSHDRSESRVNDLGCQKSMETALIEATTAIHAFSLLLESFRGKNTSCVCSENSHKQSGKLFHHRKRKQLRKSSANGPVPNIDGTWLFRIIPDISGAGYEVSKPIPYPKQALNPVLPYLKNGPKLWSIPHCGIHKTLSAIFKGLLNGSYGRIVLSAFPPGTLLTPEIVESMFWGSYGAPMDLWLSKGDFIGSKNRLFTSIF